MAVLINENTKVICQPDLVGRRLQQDGEPDRGHDLPLQNRLQLAGASPQAQQQLQVELRLRHSTAAPNNQH